MKALWGGEYGGKLVYTVTNSEQESCPEEEENPVPIWFGLLRTL